MGLAQHHIRMQYIRYLVYHGRAGESDGVVIEVREHCLHSGSIPRCRLGPRSPFAPRMGCRRIHSCNNNTTASSRREDAATGSWQQQKRQQQLQGMRTQASGQRGTYEAKP